MNTWLHVAVVSPPRTFENMEEQTPLVQDEDNEDKGYVWEAEYERPW